jgi:hypothetical protein
MTQLAPTFWRIWFTLGVISASVIMLVGSVVIVFAAFKIISSIGHNLMPAQQSRHAKRGLDQQDDQVFLPMVNYIILTVEMDVY